MSEADSRSCTLRLSARLGSEPCPRELCAFWEPGGAVLTGGCLVDRIGVDARRPDIAAYLLDVRKRLEDVRNEL